MIKKNVGWVLGLFLCITAYAGPVDTLQLVSSPVFGKEAFTISRLLETNHYRKLKFNDSLSSKVLDNYIKELDNSKIFLLASDVQSFEKYRYTLDDLTRAENVQPAFDIYNVFQNKRRARLKEVLAKLVNENFDYTIDEYYETDRDKMSWAKSAGELDEVWRKIIKSQALSLKLSGKKQEEIADVLKKRFERSLKSFEQVNNEDVFSIYMNCITEAYDPHTNYLSPKATDLFKQSMTLSLEGIGAKLQTENDYTKVAEIIPGGPAEKSKLIHPNDLITGVAQGDGEMVDVIGWRIDEVVKLIKGPKGTVVRLQVLPAQTGVNGPPVVLKFTRDKVKLEDQAAKKKVISYTANGRSMKLGVITLPGFYMDFDAYQKGDPNYRSTTRDVKKLILELQSENVDGVVMDLRNNGGGSLTEAIDLTGLFIKDGPVVQVKDSRDLIQIGADDDQGIAYNGPLVVLTNRFSASASEIFAGAIQDYHRGVIVGESTYGKGTVQNVIPLDRFINSDKDKVGELKFTIQKFYRVTGSSTQHKGVSPDIQLPSALGPEQFGESSNPTALPWDEIKKTDYQKTTDITDKLVVGLTKNYQERLKFDAMLKRYAGEIDDLKKNLNETVISLNEVKRKKEMDIAEKKKTANESLDTKLQTKDGLSTDDLSKLKDEYLREGLLILSDLVTRRIG